MNRDDTQIFERQRPSLISLAYRMLGERSEAEDVVQEAWLRWSGADRTEVQNPAAWLRRVTTNIAVDALRSARRRREVYVGPWLPEPLMDDVETGPDTSFALAQECELALLWAMERLSERERAAFILREVFDADYAELAETLQTSEANCRKLVSRAAKRVRQQAPRFDAPQAEAADLLQRFATAAAARDRATVLELLAPDAVAISDGGGKARAALRVLNGREEVAQVLLAVAEKLEDPADIRFGSANGAPAFYILTGGDNDLICTIAPDETGRVAWIYVMRNPDKLPRGRSLLN